MLVGNRKVKPISLMNISEPNSKEFTKEDYFSVVRDKRREFIFKEFSEELELIFENLKQEARKMKNCHFEVKFVCPEHFDINFTEAILRDYFKDLGYDTLTEPRKSDEQVITLTLT